MDLLDLFVKIGIDDDDLQSGLDRVGTAVSAAGTAIAATTSAAVAGVTALVKESVSAYSNYEQLIGGVQTLFTNLEGTISAAPQIIENANKAFETAGMSANQYMETVTGFSASLIQSLEGDYQKAAEVADLALRDMSDNMNKMGTSMESIQNAYSGFARENYTMLDNLKLGYQGTKAEMERLLKDAQKVTGIKYDISNLADVYNAIHVIQEQLGIAGATAEEAKTTIEGSLKSLAAAWQNLVTGISNPEADLGKLMNDVISTAETALSNLSPVIETALYSLITAIEEFTPVIIDKIPQLIDEFLPPLLDAATSIVEALVQALPDILNSIVTIVPDVINDIITTISNLLPDIVQAGIDMIVSLANGMSETLPELIPIAVDAVLQVADTLINNIDVLVDAAIQLVTSLAEGFANALPELLEKVPPMMIKLATTFVENIDKIQKVPDEIIKTIADSLVHADWTETAEKMMDGLVASLDVAQKKVKLWIDKAREALTGESIYDGDINNVPTTEFVQNLDENKGVVVDAISNFTGDIREAYDDYYGTAEDGIERVTEYSDEAIGKMADAQKQSVENAGKTTEDAIAELMARRKAAEKTVADTYTEVEEQDEKALAAAEKKRKEALKNHFRDLESMMYENGYSEEWLIHQERIYVEALDHNTELYKEYNNKLLKEEQKLTQKVDKERAKQEADRSKQLKYDLQKQFQEFEIFAVDNDKTEDWLLTQEEKYLETLDKSSDLYKEYHLKIAKQRKELTKKMIEEDKKNAENAKKSFASAIDEIIKNAKDKISEYQKAVDDIKKKIETFGDKLTDSFSSMFEFTKDEKTGKVSATKTKDFLTKRIKMLEEYYENIKKLKEKGISDTMLKELANMSAEEGSAAAEYLLKMDDSELKKLGNIWDRYEDTGDKVSSELYAEDLDKATKELDTKRNETLNEIQKTVDTKLTEVVEAVSKSDSGNLKKLIEDLNGVMNGLQTKIDTTFGEGFSVNIDGKQLVGAILPNTNTALGRITRAAIRGVTG